MHRVPCLCPLLAATALGALAAPATSSAAGAVAAPRAATADACKQALNPDRRSVYRFKNGGRTLGFGRVVVTATKAHRHRYCIQVQFGERTVVHQSGDSGYVRKDGAWVYEGAKGSGAYRTGGYTQSMQVPDRYRIDRGYGIRSGGRWYSTIAISRYNL